MPLLVGRGMAVGPRLLLQIVEMALAMVEPIGLAPRQLAVALALPDARELVVATSMRVRPIPVIVMPRSTRADGPCMS